MTSTKIMACLQAHITVGHSSFMHSSNSKVLTASASLSCCRARCCSVSVSSYSTSSSLMAYPMRRVLVLRFLLLRHMAWFNQKAGTLPGEHGSRVVHTDVSPTAIYPAGCCYCCCCCCGGGGGSPHTLAALNTLRFSYTAANQAHLTRHPLCCCCCYSQSLHIRPLHACMHARQSQHCLRLLEEHSHLDPWRAAMAAAALLRQRWRLRRQHGDSLGRGLHVNK